MTRTDALAMTTIGIAQLDALSNAFADFKASDHAGVTEELVTALAIAAVAARRLRADLQSVRPDLDFESDRTEKGQR